VVSYLWCICFQLSAFFFKFREGGIAAAFVIASRGAKDVMRKFEAVDDEQ
jgi:hypothetical protein